MPMQDFTKGRKPDLHLEITEHGQNKIQRKQLLTKTKAHEKPMCLFGVTQHAKLGFYPLLSGNSNVVTQECVDLPTQSHYSGRSTDPELDTTACSERRTNISLLTTGRSQHENKGEKNGRRDVGKETLAFKKNQDEWILPTLKKHNSKKKCLGEGRSNCLRGREHTYKYEIRIKG